MLKFIFILLLAVFLGLVIYSEPGYIVLAYAEWLFEMPLWLAVLGLVLVVMFINLLLHFQYDLASAYKDFMYRHKINSLESANQIDENALRYISLNEFQKAEKYYNKLIRANGVHNFKHLWHAAYCAHQRADYQQRDKYLEQLKTHASENSYIVNIVKANYLLEQGDLASAEELLKDILTHQQENKSVLKLQADILQTKNDWQALDTILAKIKKHEIYSPSAQLALDEKVIRYRMANIAKNEGKHALIAAWQSMPRSIRQNQALLLSYTALLIKIKALAEAEQVIRVALRSSWSKDLLQQYGFAFAADINKQVTNCEKWLKSHGDDPQLLLTLARICKQAKLWGKARNYYEASIELEPDANAYAELGEILVLVGESRRAQECIHKGLSIVTRQKVLADLDQYLYLEDHENAL